MIEQFEKSEYRRKLINTITRYLKDIKDPNILEFGVRKGISTGFFLELCKKNNGKLFSVDIDDYSNLFKDENWIFIKSRDDNIQYIEKFLPKELDVVHIDSLHEAKHVAKIFYLYYSRIKTGGFLLIDDISCLPYLKNKEKNSLGNEIANQETFDIILDIYSANNENFELDFSFLDSGFAIIKKLNSNRLNKKNNNKYRKYSVINLIRKIDKIFKKS